MSVEVLRGVRMQRVVDKLYVRRGFTWCTDAKGRGHKSITLRHLPSVPSDYLRQVSLVLSVVNKG